MRNFLVTLVSLCLGSSVEAQVPEANEMVWVSSVYSAAQAPPGSWGGATECNASFHDEGAPNTLVYQSIYGANSGDYQSFTGVYVEKTTGWQHKNSSLKIFLHNSSATRVQVQISAHSYKNMPPPTMHWTLGPSHGIYNPPTRRSCPPPNCIHPKMDFGGCPALKPEPTASVTVSLSKEKPSVVDVTQFMAKDLTVLQIVLAPQEYSHGLPITANVGVSLCGKVDPSSPTVC